MFAGANVTECLRRLRKIQSVTQLVMQSVKAVLADVKALPQEGAVVL